MLAVKSKYRLTERSNQKQKQKLEDKEQRKECILKYYGENMHESILTFNSR